MNTTPVKKIYKGLLRRSLAATSFAVLSTVLVGCASKLDMLPIGSVVLTGMQEVPPVKTTAKGNGLIKITSDKMISGSITVTGMTPTAVHIHLAPAGSVGPVILPLTKTAEPQFGESIWTVALNTRLTDTQFVHYVAGDMYVNVHSDVYPGGEIRGQLVAN